MIGVDFDNTIVCYDRLFFDAALEMGLIAAGIDKSKKAVRDHILAFRSNEDWTVLQSEVYGARLQEAEPYPGVQEFLTRCRSLSIPVCIISHKSRFSTLGKPYDFHGSALAWLDAKGFLASDGLRLSAESIRFTPTRAEKIKEIARLGCDCFIDDLPEVFAEEGFPPNVLRILFDPCDVYGAWPDGVRARSWTEIQKILLSERAV